MTNAMRYVATVVAIALVPTSAQAAGFSTPSVRVSPPPSIPRTSAPAIRPQVNTSAPSGSYKSGAPMTTVAGRSVPRYTPGTYMAPSTRNLTINSTRIPPVYLDSHYSGFWGYPGSPYYWAYVRYYGDHGSDGYGPWWVWALGIAAIAAIAGLWLSMKREW